MDMQSTVGGWIPLWILGAPLVAGLISWMTTPKPSTYRDSDRRA